MFHEVTSRPWLVRGLLFVSSILISLLLIEGLVRLVAPQELLVPFTDLVDGINAPRAAVRGRHFLPGTFDVSVSFNNQRFRGQHEFLLLPGAGSLRLAALGDSFTFGFGASDEESYPAQLQRILQARITGAGSYSKVVEVMNAGYPGTGTGEQALGYNLWVKQFHPHIVLLNVHFTDVENDLDRSVFIQDRTGAVTPRPSEELPRFSRLHRSIRTILNATRVYSFLSQHSHSFILTRNFLSGTLGPTGAPQRDPSSPIPYISPEPGDRFFKQGLPILAGEIRWLDEQVKAQHSQLVIVFLPTKEVVYSLNASERPGVIRRSEAILSMLREVCQQRTIPFLDPVPALKERAAQAAGPDLYYSGRCEHPSPTGYRTLAGLVSEFLLAKGVVPSLSSP